MSSEEGLEGHGSFAWRRLEGDMRAVSRDLEACHVAEGAGLFPAAPEGKPRTVRESSWETDSAQYKAQQPSLTMPSLEGLSPAEAASCHQQGHLGVCALMGPDPMTCEVPSSLRQTQ